MATYTFFGMEFSLYSGKARAYLRYKNIPFEEVTATVSVYKKIIIPATGVKFIPVVKTPYNKYLQDTSHIIDCLEVKHPEKSVYPTTNKQRLVSLLLELYGDEWLLIPAMHYRWNHDNFPFIYQEFGNIISPKLPKFIRAFLGKKIGSPFRSMLPTLGISNKTIPAIEKWYEQEFLPSLDLHLSKYPFLLGSAPCIGDFGFFGPLYAHLHRDPYSGQLMQKIAPNVTAWVERMKDASSVQGEFLENDKIPETLIPILTNLFDVQWPVLEDTANELSTWYAKETQHYHQQQPTEIPRKLGTHQFTIGDVKEQRSRLPYAQWMMQRPLNLYHSFSAKEQQEIEPLLKKINGLSAMSFDIENQVTRLNNKFVIE